MQHTEIFKCPVCHEPFKKLGGFTRHMELMHPNIIPNGWSGARFYYYVITGKDHGSCIVCKHDTEWNEASQKYNRFCNNPKCKEKYRNVFKSRMIQKYGKVHLLNDANKQREMLKARHISGSYTFSDKTKVDYVGSYELDFLKMMDTFLHWPSSDIMGPSPHTYSYDYKNPNDKGNEGTKFYIPDFFIPSLCLEIEIKENTTHHPKILEIDKVKEACKDELMKTIPGINYLKLVDKDYAPFFALLLQLKDDFKEDKIEQKENAAESFDYKSYLSECEKALENITI
jgi:hypothetical protein